MESESYLSQSVKKWTDVIVYASYSMATAHFNFSGSPAGEAGINRYPNALVFCPLIFKCFNSVPFLYQKQWWLCTSLQG